jgi:hypothetical protein
MSLKLKTLEDFLRKKGFLREADLCSDLSKIAMPFRKSPEGERQHFKIQKKDREGGYGWVYILKTAPIPGSSAPFSWYVGQSATPEIRYLEHAFTNFSVQQTPSDKYRKDKPYYDPIYRVNSPKFTEENPALEIVCMQLFNFKNLSPNLFRDDGNARRTIEKIIFEMLGKFVGSANIGGDSHLMRTVASKPWPPDTELLMRPEDKTIDAYKERYENTVKNYIKNKMKMSCDSGNAFPDLASDLNELEWEDISDSDKRMLLKRHDHFTGGTRRERDKAWAAEKLERLSAEDQAELGSKIRYFVKEDRDVTNYPSLIKALIEEYPSFLDELTEHKLDALTRKENLNVHIRFLSREERLFDSLGVNTISEAKLKIINVLRVNFDLTETARELSLTLSTLKGWLRDLDINYNDHLDKDPSYIKMIGRIIRKEELIQALRCSKNQGQAKRLLGLIPKKNDSSFNRRIHPILSPYKVEDYLNTATPEDYERAEREGSFCYNKNTPAYEGWLSSEDKPMIIELLKKNEGFISRVEGELRQIFPDARVKKVKDILSSFLKEHGINSKEYKSSYVKPEDTITYDEIEPLTEPLTDYDNHS